MENRTVSRRRERRTGSVRSTTILSGKSSRSRSTNGCRHLRRARKKWASALDHSPDSSRSQKPVTLLDTLVWPLRGLTFPKGVLTGLCEYRLNSIYKPSTQRMRNGFPGAAQSSKYVRKVDIAFPNTQWFNATVSNVICSIHGWPLLLSRVQVSAGPALEGKQGHTKPGSGDVLERYFARRLRDQTRGYSRHAACSKSAIARFSPRTTLRDDRSRIIAHDRLKEAC